MEKQVTKTITLDTEEAEVIDQLLQFFFENVGEKKRKRVFNEEQLDLLERISWGI